ncbi:hypothetical protein [Enterococcus wangshanyuanii]|uniref:Uncharacterized protein n=1 Tax=Enterococcus wangshanyuanii TaxID=2005703 RepID=A0ABQ1PWV6_9ENTE|nr:hypothetical protein [Enterococcus wangshanyuanii]GGD05771.1 hypothetical protein GCM10011573_38990 [Enterococcus wangshanyuanii]
MTKLFRKIVVIATSLFIVLFVVSFKYSAVLLLLGSFFYGVYRVYLFSYQKLCQLLSVETGKGVTK